ncbi:MAG: hypothetical protein FWF44_03690 [Defluviitaleaceae bacterium]|nr:hypothetical protein [Defluviitaleaceae bacterium]
MNTDMLKYIVESAGGKLEPAKLADFYAKYPHCQQTTNDLTELKRRGLVTYSYAGNELYTLFPTRKAIELVEHTLA